MERLTETNNCIGFMETYLNVNCEECQYKNTKECENFKDECKAVADFKVFVKNMHSKLKEYEDLEEQGKLLKLSCKIGDTIYVIPSEVNFKLNIVNRHEENNRVYKQVVNRIEICKSDYLLSTCDGMACVSGKSYKKTWFLSYEEAEAALKEL